MVVVVVVLVLLLVMLLAYRPEFYACFVQHMKKKNFFVVVIIFMFICKRFCLAIYIKKSNNNNRYLCKYVYRMCLIKTKYFRCSFRFHKFINEHVTHNMENRCQSLAPCGKRRRQHWTPYTLAQFLFFHFFLHEIQSQNSIETYANA